jgi:hypothetical protein
MRWEYKVVDLNTFTWTTSARAAESEALMNELGRQGWELVGVETIYFYFKRPAA